jgi:demethylmenaquinone methyltransferase/2-methoxy-6-polyprenyl-1,4-benzoquinol methylase
LVPSLVKQVSPGGQVITTDINETMLQLGRDKLTNTGILHPVEYVLADAEALPFTDHAFDCVTVAFGLRNMTNPSTALRTIYRVLKPGGRLLVLEFSRPAISLLSKLYDYYSFHIIPKIGQLVVHDSDSYQYLIESIRMHPDQETLKTFLSSCDFEDVTYYNLSGGIVALHKGYKY